MAQLKDCATCSTQVIKEQQISKLSIDELRFLTNDLYARKGYKFKDYEISNYFNEKQCIAKFKNRNPKRQ